MASAWEKLSTHIHGQSSGWREEALCSTVVCGYRGLSLPTLLKSLASVFGGEGRSWLGGADPSGKVSWLPQQHPWCHCLGSSGGGLHEIRSLSDTLRWFGGRMCGKGKKSKEIKETVLPVPVPGPQLQDAPTRGRTNVWLPVWVSLPWSDMN